MDAMKILFMASEAEPLIKVGGLGDVGYSLPAAIQEIKSDHEKEIDIRLAVPAYSCLEGKYKNTDQICEFDIPYKNSSLTAKIYNIHLNGLETFLISGEPFEENSNIYSNNPLDDGKKFFFFCVACLELGKQLGWIPDIFHLNDWHTAVTAHLIKNRNDYQQTYQNTRTLLTIHNLPYTGLGTEPILADFHIPYSENSHAPQWAKNLPLALGIESADRIVAVSPTYAEEIKTVEYGGGLENFIQQHSNKLTGIINGIDPEKWNPASDKLIFKTYNSKKLEKKQLNKEHFLKEMEFSGSFEAPLLIYIGRIDHQKGIELALSVLDRMISEEWHAVFLGTGNEQLEYNVKYFEDKFPSKFRAEIKYDANLARQLYAAGDFILVPSNYEPCGLVQMIAMRYGCIPIASNTGGLTNTIEDFEENPKNGNGYLFEKNNIELFENKVRTGFSDFQNKTTWKKIQQNAMAKDFSWNHSANEYLKIYQEMQQS